MPQRLTALHGLESSGQHCYAGEHDFGSLHLEARLFQGTLDVIWRKTHCIWVVQHASEEIPGGKGRVLTSVVDHEIVHEDSPQFDPQRSPAWCVVRFPDVRLMVGLEQLEAASPEGDRQARSAAERNHGHCDQGIAGSGRLPNPRGYGPRLKLISGIER